LPFDPAAAAATAVHLDAAGIGPTDRIIVIHVSAGNPFRRWTAEAFAETAAELAARHPDARVIMVGSAAERTAVGGVVDLARNRLGSNEYSHVIAWADGSLADLRALIDRAALFIGGDSGPLHIAATSAVPIVALFGPTLPVRSAPWRSPAFVTETVDVGPLECRPCDQRVCTPGDFRCLGGITPAAVVLAAERALAQTRGLADLEPTRRMPASLN